MKQLALPLLSLITLLLSISCKKTNKNNPSKESNSTSIVNLISKDSADYRELESQIPELLKKYGVPAVSVAHIKNGEIAWHFVNGMQDEKKEANEETLFLTASIAKPMTAEVFLRLMDQGKVSLDEPMSNYWLDPDLADDPRAKLHTPRHVLPHETGFKNWRYQTEGKLRFERDPGQLMGYSGEGLQYLVRFVENKLQKDFNAVAEEVLFSPEVMQNTAMKEQSWYQGRLAAPKFPDGKWRGPVVFSSEKKWGFVAMTNGANGNYDMYDIAKKPFSKKLE